MFSIFIPREMIGIPSVFIHKDLQDYSGQNISAGKSENFQSIDNIWDKFH